MGQRPHVAHDVALRAEDRPRSHGLSVRCSMAILHSSTARMRWRRRRAVSGFASQIGVQTASTSALVTSETGRLPMRQGVVFQALEPVGRLSGAVQPVPFCSTTVAATSARVDMPRKRPAVRQRVAARAGERALGEGLLAGLGERDEMDAAESEFVLPAADDKALDPASGPGTLDVEVEAIAVGVRLRRVRSGRKRRRVGCGGAGPWAWSSDIGRAVAPHVVWASRKHPGAPERRELAARLRREGAGEQRPLGQFGGTNSGAAGVPDEVAPISWTG